MSFMPSFLVLSVTVALGTAVPFGVAGAADGPDAGLAELASEPAKMGGLFAGLFTKDPTAQQARAERRAAAKAERAAEREARRAERQRAKAAGHGQSASTGDSARAEVKAAVAEAVANKPKGRIWCVPFARAVTGVDIRGNAKTWWHQAEGRYARGQEPEVGAVMAFAASRAMPKGHVAVVSKVLSEREVLVDQANWERNQITLDTLVVDVSDKGDWSRVKVASTTGLSRRQVADDLGVGLSTLNKWVNAHRDTDVISAEDRELARENERLRREIRILKEERDILKKATQFFASLKP